VLENSSIDTADDGICIKSTLGMQDTFNVTVRHVSVRSRSSAVKFGSTTPTDIHDLVFDDLYIWDSNGGLSIQARDQVRRKSGRHRTTGQEKTRDSDVGAVGSVCCVFLSVIV